MANFKLLLNDGTSELLLNVASSVLLLNDKDTSDNCDLLLNDGTSKLLYNDAVSIVLLDDESCGSTPTPGAAEGGVGGRVRKKAGRQLSQGDLGPRPTTISSAESKGKIILKLSGESKSKLSFTSRVESIGEPWGMKGSSHAKIIITTRNESMSKLLTKAHAESWGITHPSVVMERVNSNNIKLAKINHYREILNQIDETYQTTPHKVEIKGFEFNEVCHNEQLIAFTHSSSFIGNVRYNTETQEMRVILNGKSYNFCGVPQRIYDAFEGANSKGAFFARSIRTQFDC